METTSWEKFNKWSKFKTLFKEGSLTLEDLSAIIPGALHINSRSDFSFRYLSRNGCDFIGYNSNQLQKEGNRILDRHQSSFTREITHPTILKELNSENPEKILLFYQDWKRPKKPPFFFLTTTRVWNEEEFLSISYFPGEVEHITKKINPLFGINTIFSKHFDAYNLLTKREKEILDLLAKDLSRCQIASQLFVAEATIKKHCENIYRKLGTHKRTELERIAVSFLTIENRPDGV